MVGSVHGSDRTHMADMLRRECEGKLINPSLQLSHSLVHLFILVCPNSSHDRLNRAVHVCAQIEACATDKEASDASRRKRIQSGKPESSSDDDNDENEDEDDDDDEDDESRRGGDKGRRKDRDKGKGKGKSKGKASKGGDTFMLVCAATLVPTVIAVVSVLDKVLTETESLLKIREKQRSGFDIKSRKLMGSEGHLLNGAGTGGGGNGSGSDDDEGLSVERMHAAVLDGKHEGLVKVGRSGSRKSFLRLQTLDLADEAVYVTMLRLFEAACQLLHSSIGDASERVIGLLSRLYKLQVRISHTLVGLKVTSLPQRYATLATFISMKCSQRIEAFLVAVRNVKYCYRY